MTFNKARQGDAKIRRACWQRYVFGEGVNAKAVQHH